MGGCDNATHVCSQRRIYVVDCSRKPKTFGGERNLGKNPDCWKCTTDNLSQVGPNLGVNFFICSIYKKN